MTATQLYWLITLPKLGQNLSDIFLILSILTGIFGFALFMAWVDNDNVFSLKPIKISCILLFIFCTLSFICGTFIPSQKEIIGIYGISYMSQDKNLQDIPPKLFELAKVKIDELLKK